MSPPSLPPELLFETCGLVVAEFLDRLLVGDLKYAPPTLQDFRRGRHSDPALQDGAPNPVLALLQTSLDVRGAALKLLSIALGIRLDGTGIGRLEDKPWSRIHPIRLVVWKAKVLRTDGSAPLKALEYTGQSPLLNAYELLAYIVAGTKSMAKRAFWHTTAPGFVAVGGPALALQAPSAVQSTVLDHVNVWAAPLTEALERVNDFETAIAPSCLRTYAQYRPEIAHAVSTYWLTLETTASATVARLRPHLNRRGAVEVPTTEAMVETALFVCGQGSAQVHRAWTKYKNIEQACGTQMLLDLDDFFDPQSTLSHLPPQYGAMLLNKGAEAERAPLLPRVQECLKVMQNEWEELYDELQEQESTHDAAALPSSD